MTSSETTFNDEELIARLRLYGSKFHHEFGHNDAADRIEALIAERDEANKRGDAWRFRADIAEVKLAKAVEALEECMEEIDAYIRQEYPHDHPVQERYRQRDYAANPARLALAEIKGESHE